MIISNVCLVTKKNIIVDESSLQMYLIECSANSSYSLKFQGKSLAWI